MRNIPSLDGLRAIAILLVLIAHAGGQTQLSAIASSHHLAFLVPLISIDLGELGVSVFFVISGFLITTLLLREKEQRGSQNLYEFYIRRAFRIFPPYYFYLITVFFLMLFGLSHVSTGAMWSSAAYLSNYYPYALSRPDSQGWFVGHTWTLSLEEQFYVFSPFLLHFAGKRRTLYTYIGIVLLAPLSRVLTFWAFPGLSFDHQIVRMFHTRIDTIVFGCILALALDMGLWKRAIALCEKPITAFIALVVMLVDCVLMNERPFFTLAVGLSILGITLAILIFFLIRNSETAVGRLLNHPVVTYVGVTSYSIYLWQQLFLGAHPLVHGHLAAVALIIVASQFSYWIVEKRSRSLRDILLSRMQKRSLA